MAANTPQPALLAPHSVEAEQAALGGILIYNRALDAVKAILRPEDWFIVRHSHIYCAMLDLDAAGTPIDLVTLTERLEQMGKLTDIGGPVYVAQLANNTPTSMHTEHYARLVAAASQRRRWLATADLIRAQALDETQNIEAAQGQIAAAVRQTMDHHAPRDAARSLSDLLVEQDTRIDTMASRRLQGLEPDEFAYAVTPLSLQNLMGSLHETEVVTVAGRPGAGKSIMLHDWTRHAAANVPAGKRVVLYTREMTAASVTNALVAAHGRIPLTSIIDATLTSDQARKLAATHEEMDALPIDIDDRTAYWEDMVADLQKRHRLGTLSVALFDYLRLINTRERFRGDSATRLRMGYIMSNAKQVANDLRCVIVFAAQLNRDGERAPTLSNLKDSGATEEDSDRVIFVHPDAAEDGEERPVITPVSLIVAKNRNGPVGSVRAGRFNTYRTMVDVRSENW